MIQKKTFYWSIIFTIVISSGLTYFLTKRSSFNQNDYSIKNKILQDSLTITKNSLDNYTEALIITKTYLSDKNTSEISLSEKLQNSSDSIILDIINNLKTYKEQTRQFSSKTEYKVITDTLVKVETSPSLSDKELSKLKEELNSTIHELEDLKNIENVLELVSSKGKKFYYTGQTSSGKANGYGVGIFETGSIYKGYWKDNLRHGIGSFTWNDKEYYEGSFVNGKREGYGEYHWKNGEIYKGYWKNDMRHGNGKLYKKNGKLKKEGFWENDELK